MMCAAHGGLPGPTAAPYFADFIEGRRGEILDAALAVFGEKGYEAGTMREIAAKVGVSEPAIYRHYASKEAILTDIVATAGDRISAGMRQGLAALDAGNVSAMLHALIETRRGILPASPAEILADEPPPAFDSDAGRVLHVLAHAAPHNANFGRLLKAHLGQPMLDAVRDAIPRVDAGFGIKRTPREVDAKVHVWVSLFAGYFLTTPMFGTSADDDGAIVEAVLRFMGWESE
jgi:AcrR family transcriptional regulator